MKKILGVALTLIAGIFATIQGYQGITGAAITGNVVGASVGTGISSLAVIFGMLFLVGAFLMIVSETIRFGGIFTIILGALSAVITLGASLVPALIAVAGGFLGMVGE